MPMQPMRTGGQAEHVATQFGPIEDDDHGDPKKRFDVSIRHREGYTRVTVSGQPTFDQLLSLLHLLGVHSESWDNDAMMADLRGVQTPFSPAEQFRVGEEAASSLVHLRKIASVVPAERLTRISEKAAQRSGTNVCVFDSEELALRWLREAG